MRTKRRLPVCRQKPKQKLPVHGEVNLEGVVARAVVARKGVVLPVQAEVEVVVEIAGLVEEDRVSFEFRVTGFGLLGEIINKLKLKIETGMSVNITAAEINKLRQQTGAGMMDCRKALVESNGDFEAAIDYLRKKGQKVAALRSDREAKEGVIIATTTPDNKTGFIVTLACETDFVAKNADFIA